MNKWKVTWHWACVLILAVPAVALAQNKPRIVVVTHGQTGDPFWLIVRNGVDAAARETGVDVEYRAPERFDMVAMAQLVDAAAASRPAGMVVSIPDTAALSKSIQAAAARLPVVVINSGSEVYKKLGCLMYIGQEEVDAGNKAGRRMKALGVKKVVILNQEIGNFALEQRAKGFTDGFAGPFHHVEVLPVKMDFSQCRAAVAAYLAENRDVDGIMALGPIAAEPALEVLNAEGKIGKIQLCAFDLSPALLDALSNRQMAFALDQQQWLQGYLPVVFLANYAKYGLILQNDFILTGPSFVTPENAGRVVDLLTLGFH
ncbi:MAG TPA: sugar ABC transporter substrate-binding protein [Chthoniobacterales bacterium]